MLGNCTEFATSEFSFSVIATHYSNSDESIKLIAEPVASSLKKERERESLSPTKKGWSSWTYLKVRWHHILPSL